MVLVTKKRAAPLKHRKRIGQHHKRDKTYEKHYWPYLPLLAIAGLGFLFNIFWAPLSQVVTPHGVLSYATNTGIDGLLAATNVQRTDNSQTELTLNDQLNNAAQAKANDMAARNYWSHNTPDGIEPWWFFSQAGYAYQLAGENLAYGFDNSAATVTGWMNSPGHRANILNASFREVGFGIANVTDYQSHGNQTIVVAMYGKSLYAIDGSAKAKPTPTPTPATQKAAIAPTPTPTPVTTTPPAAEPPATPAEAVPPSPAAQIVPPPSAEQETLIAPGGQPITVASKPKDISRLELVGQNVPTWSVAVTSLIILAAGAIFIIRHLHYLHQILVKGEVYALKHPAFDVIIVLLIVIGVLLTRTAGNIR